ncbi:MAG: ABC transporter permease [Chloroflexi bacterium]|nr:ABC transporter permease [Chloroflexota bacterium]
MRGVIQRLLSSPGYAATDASFKRQLRFAIADLIEGARGWRSWLFLASEAVKSQYRRTVLGPWWITLQAALFIVGLSVLFGAILDVETSGFLPYVALGWITFNFMAGCVRGATTAFVNAGLSIISARQPLSRLVFRLVMVEFIQLLHNLLIVAVLIIVGWIPVQPASLLAVPAIAVLVLNAIFGTLWLAPLVARFRDVGPIVASALQVLMFFTPIFWTTSSLDTTQKALLLTWNPFAYFVELVREPLLGTSAPIAILAGTALITIANVAIGVVVFARTRSRIPYWVS